MMLYLAPLSLKALGFKEALASRCLWVAVGIPNVISSRVEKAAGSERLNDENVE